MLEKWKERQQLYGHIYKAKEILKVKEYKVVEDGFCNDNCKMVIQLEEKLDSNIMFEI